MTRYTNTDKALRELYVRYKTATGDARKAYSEAIDILTATEDMEIVRCQECTHMDFVYPYCREFDTVVEEDGFCYRGKEDA